MIFTVFFPHYSLDSNEFYATLADYFEQNREREKIKEEKFHVDASMGLFSLCFFIL